MAKGRIELPCSRALYAWRTLQGAAPTSPVEELVTPLVRPKNNRIFTCQHVLFMLILCILSVKPFYSGLALISFLPHKPCVGCCAAAEKFRTLFTAAVLDAAERYAVLTHWVSIKV